MRGLHEACKAAAFAGLDTDKGSPEALWEWMDQYQKDGVIRMVRAALASLKDCDVLTATAGAETLSGLEDAPMTYSAVAEAVFSDMLDAVLSESGM